MALSALGAGYTQKTVAFPDSVTTTGLHPRLDMVRPHRQGAGPWTPALPPGHIFPAARWQVMMQDLVTCTRDLATRLSPPHAPCLRKGQWPSVPRAGELGYRP